MEVLIACPSINIPIGNCIGRKMTVVEMKTFVSLTLHYKNCKKRRRRVIVLIFATATTNETGLVVGKCSSVIEQFFSKIIAV